MHAECAGSALSIHDRQLVPHCQEYGWSNPGSQQLGLDQGPRQGPSPCARTISRMLIKACGTFGNFAAFQEGSIRNPVTAARHKGAFTAVTGQGFDSVGVHAAGVR